METRGKGWIGLAVFAAVATLVASASRVEAQEQRGGVSRARAARDLIIIAVQQGISTLPPTAGQSFSFEFKESLGVYVQREEMGPTTIASPRTAGKGSFVLRVGGSFFQLDDTLSSLYSGTFEPDQGSEFARLGVDTEATIGVVNVAAVYGLLPNLDLNLNLPISVVDADARTRDSQCGDDASTPNSSDSCLKSTPTTFALPEQEFEENFNEGTHAGVGRIALGAKWMAFDRDAARLGALTDLFFPSPNQDEFAGSDTFAIFPRVALQVPLARMFQLLGTAGYDYDFDDAALRRFVWNAGGMLVFPKTTIDFGAGGSEFDERVQFNPDSFTLRDSQGQRTIRNISDNEVNNSYVDFLFGVKRQISKSFVLSAAVNVPLTQNGLRPDAFYSVALEYWISRSGS